VNLLGKLRKELVHAFALSPIDPTFALEETALLEKVARLIAQRGMTMPALLFLESVGPLNFLGSRCCTDSDLFWNWSVMRQRWNGWRRFWNGVRVFPV